ncbi:UrcA family protein [Erythrobacter sp. WG]|uniref:UrcA family protein n=1 Tax=Erythrobacter sp. WG TaxID=2985510 RepID=UPI00226E8DA0|nr:UrcA family protein [Erythrobacter sp. WG]MCX9146902.1 UrcA family protein [Erythrobacter sp. WG]
MNTLAKIIVPALATLGIAGTAVTPAVAENVDRSFVSVSYRDLDLATAKGQKLFDQRVERAVRQVCRTTNPSTGTRLMSQDALACLAKARSDAKQKMAAIIANEQRGG